MDQRSGEWSIGAVAKLTGVSVDTLRLYEREGLFPHPVGRTAAGQRVYTERDVEWLGYCLRFRATGMPLSTIRRFAELVRQGPGNERERLALLRQHQQRVREQLRELTEHMTAISEKVTRYEHFLARGAEADLWDARM